jgi:hypothetical protein
VLVAHTCNPSYSGGRDQEDHSLKSAREIAPQDPISKKGLVATPPTTGVGEDAGKKEPSYTVGGNVD